MLKKYDNQPYLIEFWKNTATQCILSSRQLGLRDARIGGAGLRGERLERFKAKRTTFKIFFAPKKRRLQS